MRGGILRAYLWNKKCCKEIEIAKAQSNSKHFHPITQSRGNYITLEAHPPLHTFSLTAPNFFLFPFFFSFIQKQEKE